MQLRYFVKNTCRSIARLAAHNSTLKDAWHAFRVEDDPKFCGYPIYEHCLSSNVSRAYDETRSIAHPRISTIQRDIEM